MLGQCEGVLHVYAQIADRILDLAVPKQDLHGTQVARRLIDDSSEKRMAQTCFGFRARLASTFIPAFRA
jgi:hypothetical protein